MFNASVVHIGVKVFSDCFCEKLAKVGAIVAKKRGNRLQLDILVVIVINIIKNVL